MPARPCPACSQPVAADAAFCAHCGAAAATQIFGETPSGSPSEAGPGISYEREPDRLRRALGPNFELGRLIGRGGYAEVFAVRDLRLKRELAAKVLRPDLIVTPAILARFRREAEAVATLAHPNIVPVFDVGEAEGVCFILMPLIRGESLKAAVHRQRRLPLDEVIRIVTEAAGALGAAHRAGVIHRDIKPENIMLEGDDRRVRLMDFGISKAMDSSETQLTGTGVIVGTPQYMSPEQASGDPNVDHRSDQYSLAVCAYQMIGGRAPFDGDTARAVMTKQLLEDPVPLPELVDHLPPAVSAGLFRALQKDPAKRFDSIEAFAKALVDPTITAAPAWHRGTEPEPVPVRRQRRALPWIVAAATLGIVAVAATQLRTPTAAPRSVDSTAAPAPTPPPPPPPTVQRDTAARRPLPVVVTPVKVDSQVVPPRQPPDTSTPPVATVVDCAGAVARQDWEIAFERCQAEGRTNPMAARRVAEMASSGRGTGVDERLATNWYEIAAPNDPIARFALAGRYDRGIGTTKDPSRATDLYLEAARGGVTDAYPIIADRLAQGIGRPRDEVEAVRWFERGANSAHVGSQVRLGLSYLNGRGVARNDSAARRWFGIAAERESAVAQYELGRLLLRGGRGVPKDEAAGLLWLERAANSGHDGARQELGRRKPR